MSRCMLISTEIPHIHWQTHTNILCNICIIYVKVNLLMRDPCLQTWCEHLPRTAFTVGTAGSGGATTLYGTLTVGDSTGRVCNKEVFVPELWNMYITAFGSRSWVVWQLAGLQVLWNRGNISLIAIFHRCHRFRNVVQNISYLQSRICCLKELPHIWMNVITSGVPWTSVQEWYFFQPY